MQIVEKRALPLYKTKLELLELECGFIPALSLATRILFGLLLRPRDARLAQAHVLTAHHAASLEGDRDAMRESERATAEHRRASEHRYLLGLLGRVELLYPCQLGYVVLRRWRLLVPQNMLTAASSDVLCWVP